VTRRLPFNRPFVVGRELDYIREAIAGGHLSGNGPFALRCTEWLNERVGCRGSLLTHSCTGALEIAAILSGVGEGDEVIMPSFTFVSTANAFVLRGATPVFVDVRPDTLNLDETLLESAISKRTRAIVPVHYAGVGCELDAVLELARRDELMVIEDAAQGLMSSYRGRPLGSDSALAAVSFHETKNVVSGEGGALLVNDPALLARAEIVHEKGTDRSRFFRGEIDKYSWVDIGGSFVASEINAAFLWAQLEQADAITGARRALWQRYHELLSAAEADGLLRRPIVPEHTVHNAHMYYVLLRDLETRATVIESLRSDGIHAVFHYVPLHSSPAGRRFGRAGGSLRVTENASERLLRLPLWAGMTDSDVERVVESLVRALRLDAAARVQSRAN
jgi:dTDP-4-amino-4,6-dideoxygalactose transaminase